MKATLLFTLILFCIPISFSQRNEEAYYEQLRIEDSIKLTKFLKQVDRMELLELGVTCRMDSTYDDDTYERKLVQKCFLKGAISESGVDSTKITGRKPAAEINPFFRVFISSVQNEYNITGACYQPRNGILFFDKQNRFLAYLEICFECHGINGINSFGLSGFTSNQYDELECLFNQNGLKTK